MAVAASASGRVDGKRLAALSPEKKAVHAWVVVDGNGQMVGVQFRHRTTSS